MFGFNAFFYKNHVMIEGAGAYKTNEVLLAYLDYEFPNLNELLTTCKEYERKLHYPERGNENLVFDKMIQGAFMFYDRLDNIIEALPPYDKMQVRRNRLYNIVNEYRYFFDNEKDPDPNDHSYPDEYDHFYCDKYYDDLDADMYDSALQMNRRLKALAEEYRIFVEDCIRVKTVYSEFLEKIHYRNEYVHAEETAEIFKLFLEEKSGHGFLRTFDELAPSGNMSQTFVPLVIEDHTIMCEKYRFGTIGGFLYIDLFKGLDNHFLPRKCGLCERYFLLEASVYSAFCTRPSKENKKKTCRDLGHRKTYADKVNNDPILKTYTKAYKAHYARFMKKRMTQKEFQIWADYALELRAKAYSKELEFVEYEKKIKE